jgi:hypothetical protein
MGAGGQWGLKWNGSLLGFSRGPGRTVDSGRYITKYSVIKTKVNKWIDVQD